MEDRNNQFDIYDPASDVWSIGMMNQGFVYAGVISVNNIIYIAGEATLNQVWKLEF